MTSFEIHLYRLLIGADIVVITCYICWLVGTAVTKRWTNILNTTDLDKNSKQIMVLFVGIFALILAGVAALLIYAIGATVL